MNPYSTFGYEPHLRSALTSEIHVWLASTAFTSDAGALEALLNADELQRCHRLQFTSDRQQFLVAHALKRLTLSRYMNVPPKTWAFATHAYGRPTLVPELNTEHLFFSLSHTRGLCACAVSAYPYIGVDVEYCRALPNITQLEHRCMTLAERLADDCSDVPFSRQETFLTRWTLKEAYSKALGLGLNLPFNQIVVRLDRQHNQAFLAPSTQHVQKAHQWYLTYGRLVGGHHLAVAVGPPTKTPRPLFKQYTVDLIPSFQSLW